MIFGFSAKNWLKIRYYMSDLHDRAGQCNMEGSVSEKCNELAKHLWHFCIQENIWISALHILGKENTVADYISRSLHDNTEWQLAPIIFKNIVHTFNFVPE